MTDQHKAYHEAWMERCLALARYAHQQGNTPVGAIVIWQEQCIAEASELLPSTLDITGHAEILAVRQACQTLQTRDLTNCTLYTTAEPCWMCSYAIRDARISQVVIGTLISEGGGLSSRYPLLSDPTIQQWSSPPNIVSGILLEKCLELYRL